MKCVLYTRVSSKEQEREGFSIPAQRKLLLEYARKRGIEAAQEFSDVETAKSAGRTAFGQMVQFLRIHRDIRAILVEKTDRLYRNLRDWVEIEDLGLEVHLVKEGEVLTKDSHSHTKFIHGINVLMAKNYIDNLSEEVKKGMQEMVEEGEWPHRAPLGYLNDRVTHTLVVDPDRGPIVARLFETYATGRYSISLLREKAKELGLRYRGSNSLVSRSWIEKLLKNPIYSGRFKWKGRIYQGTHMPLISQETFDRVQETLQNVRKPKGHKHQFAFRGLLTCGHCGCAITAEIKKGRYIYYRCTNGKGRCPQPYIPESHLAEMLAETVKRITISAETAEEIRLALKDSFDKEQDFRETELRQLRQQSDKLQARIDQCYRDKLDGQITVGFWQTTHHRLLEDQDRLSDRVRRLEKANRDYYQTGVSFLELAQSAHSLYVEQKPKEQAELLRNILSNCVLTDLNLSPTYKKPFNYLVEEPRTEIWRRR